MARHALLVATTEHADPMIARLAAPEADVRALQDILLDPTIGGFDSAPIALNRSSQEIREEIEAFLQKRARDDLLLLYFSGHGVLDDRGQLFLAMTNTRVGRLKSTAIPAAFVREEMDGCRSNRQLLILDCCYSGAFAGAKAVVGTPVRTEAAFGGAGFGRVVLTATDATQFAFEGEVFRDDLRNSLFTHFILEGLRTGNADLDGDGKITIDELYTFAYERVRDASPRQTPGKWTYKQQGDIVVARTPTPPPRPDLIPPDLLANLERPERWARVSAVTALVELLNDERPGLVRAARDKLVELVADDSKRIAELAREALAKHGATVLAQETPATSAPAKPSEDEQAPPGQGLPKHGEDAPTTVQTVQGMSPEERTVAIIDEPVHQELPAPTSIASPPATTTPELKVRTSPVVPGPPSGSLVPDSVSIVPSNVLAERVAAKRRWYAMASFAFITLGIFGLSRFFGSSSSGEREPSRATPSTSSSLLYSQQQIAMYEDANAKTTTSNDPMGVDEAGVARDVATDSAVSATPTVALRASPKGLTLYELMDMLKSKNLFDNRWNTKGAFNNIFKSCSFSDASLIYDASSGLLWGKVSRTEMGSGEAQRWINGLNETQYAGLKDWRLPTMEELSTLLEERANNGKPCADFGGNDVPCIDPIFGFKAKPPEMVFLWSGDRAVGQEGTNWAVMMNANSPQHYGRWATSRAMPVMSTKGQVTSGACPTIQ